MTTTNAAATDRPPLWPQPIEVLGATGPYASGKSLLTLSICPGPETLSYDLEKSTAPYQPALGFTRIDVPAELLKRHPRGYKPIDLWLWWLESVRSQPPGKYRVIAVDPANDLESGLVDWVKQNPGYFGATANQYQKMGAIALGHAKEHLKMVLADLASRCETFAFTTHLGEIWVDNKPSGKMRPKGKSTLEELATLYLHLERPKDAKGNVQAKPSATVRKTRLSSIRVDAATGDVTIIPTLPPRIPEATPAAIRRYMATPPDYAKLTDAERAPDPVMTDDDRAAVRLATAEAEREAESMRLAREERQREAAERRAASATATSSPTPTTTPTANGTPTNVTPKAPQPALSGRTTDQQLSKLVDLRSRMWAACGCETDAAKDELWQDILRRRGVSSARDLTVTQADELIYAIRKRLGEVEPMERLFAGESAEQIDADTAADAAAARGTAGNGPPAAAT